jgi:hypothetical protein
MRDGQLEAVIEQGMHKDDTARALARLSALEATTSTLRHDLRGILAPALLVADRLLAHPDPKVVKAGEIVVKSVRRAEARLLETKDE